MKTDTPLVDREALAAELADRARSVGAMLDRRVRETPDNVAFRYPDAQENWQDLTWRQSAEIAHDIAAGLLAVGLQPEERVAIAATTRVEWILADLGVMCAGGATTTVYPTTQHDDVSFILTDSASRVAIIEDGVQLQKLLRHPEIVDTLLAIVMMDGDSELDNVHSWAAFQEMGRAYSAEHPDAVREAIEVTGPDSLSTLIYTSGTTGRPKGVRLPHDAWAYEGRSVELFRLLQPEDVQLLWLPLSHVFGKCLLAIQLQIGFTTAVDGRIDRIVDNLATIRPTWMAGAPRIFEKVRAKVMMTSASGVKNRIARWAFKVGHESIPYRLDGRPMPKALAAQYALADKLVFSKLKQKLGGNLRFMVSGSAKLSKQVQDWFYAAGILVFEGYGMTETSAVTFLNDPREPIFGSVGSAMPGTKAKVADDGEILVKGPGVMRGYHNLPEMDAEVFTDGWFHTGDIGQIDDQGNLRITDRKKDLIKTSGGKYVAPQKVEGALVANCPYISQVVAYGEGRKYMSALVALDPEALRSWAGHHDNGSLKSLSDEQLLAHDEVKAMVQRYVDAANQRLERWETVKRFAILPGELNVDDGTTTPSLKIRRAQVTQKYADLVESLYDKED
ncbi:long-chain fatty acid--CoA ligase [Mariniluteicoccus endophyticus]